jgi:hypothetical protein
MKSYAKRCAEYENITKTDAAFRWLEELFLAAADEIGPQFMKALLLGAAPMYSEPLSLLLPLRQASLFPWCLDQGFRALMPMTLMAMRKHQKPARCYLPSVLC